MLKVILLFNDFFDRAECNMSLLDVYFQFLLDV